MSSSAYNHEELLRHKTLLLEKDKEIERMQKQLAGRMQSIPVAAAQWEQLTYAFEEKSDTFILFFGGLKSLDEVGEAKNLSQGVSVHFAKQQSTKIGAITFVKASSLLPCHFSDTSFHTEGKKNLQLSCNYCAAEDILNIYFLDKEDLSVEETMPIDEDESILADYDSKGRILSLEILDASDLFLARK